MEPGAVLAFGQRAAQVRHDRVGRRCPGPFLDTGKLVHPQVEGRAQASADADHQVVGHRGGDQCAAGPSVGKRTAEQDGVLAAERSTLPAYRRCRHAAFHGQLGCLRRQPRAAASALEQQTVDLRRLLARHTIRESGYPSRAQVVRLAAADRVPIRQHVQRLGTGLEGVAVPIRLGRFKRRLRVRYRRLCTARGARRYAPVLAGSTGRIER